MRRLVGARKQRNSDFASAIAFVTVQKLDADCDLTWRTQDKLASQNLGMRLTPLPHNSTIVLMWGTQIMDLKLLKNSAASSASKTLKTKRVSWRSLSSLSQK